MQLTHIRTRTKWEVLPQSLVVEPDVALRMKDGRLHAALGHDLSHLLGRNSAQFWLN